MRGGHGREGGSGGRQSAPEPVRVPSLFADIDMFLSPLLPPLLSPPSRILPHTTPCPDVRSALGVAEPHQPSGSGDGASADSSVGGGADSSADGGVAKTSGDDTGAGDSSDQLNGKGAAGSPPQNGKGGKPKKGNKRRRSNATSPAEDAERAQRFVTFKLDPRSNTYMDPKEAANIDWKAAAAEAKRKGSKSNAATTKSGRGSRKGAGKGWRAGEKGQHPSVVSAKKKVSRRWIIGTAGGRSGLHVKPDRPLSLSVSLFLSLSLSLSRARARWLSPPFPSS